MRGALLIPAALALVACVGLEDLPGEPCTLEPVCCLWASWEALHGPSTCPKPSPTSGNTVDLDPGTCSHVELTGPTVDPQGNTWSSTTTTDGEELTAARVVLIELKAGGVCRWRQAASCGACP